jgi:pimeloyl-ACP methyl ester carboxylesterase
MMPFHVLGIWFRGLLALALLGLGAYLVSTWREHRRTETVETIAPGPLPDQRPPLGAAPTIPEPQTRVHIERPEFGLNAATGLLLAGLLILAWSLGGGWLVSPRLRRRSSADEPGTEPGQATQLRLADGTELRIRMFGPPDGDPLVLTHGWGLDGDEWCYAVRELSTRYRLIVWDLPGLGGSSRPRHRDWSLEQLARNLDEVVRVAGVKPVTLVGHSIGVMITLTYCRMFPETLGGTVRRLVLAQGTYTNPVRTTKNAWLYTALEKPVLRPLCHLMIWLSPVVRVLNWMSFLNGSAHRSTERDSFSGNETRGQLDFVTRAYCQAPPDVVAHGMLAMLDYDATKTLGRITVPTLVVAGEDDRTCTPEAGRTMAASIRGAKLTMLPQMRHLGLFEQHGPFHAAVEEFLRETTSAPAGPHVREVRVSPPAA